MNDWINRCHFGDVRDVLRRMIADGVKVNTIVTSPPYHALRSYLPAGHPDKELEIGSESTVEQFLEKLVDVFDLCRQVLRDDGTIWLNMGDSYGPNKQLVGQPWRLALALREPYFSGQIKSALDRAWLAAIIDGEGCFFIHKRKAGSSAHSKFTRADGTEANYVRTADTYGVGLEICNTHKAIIDRVQQIAGMGTIVTQSPKQNPRRKQTIYRWRISPNEAKRLAQELYPHLIGKQHQARLIFNCPSTGEAGAAAHQAMMDLHNGLATDVDYPAPPSLFRPGFVLRQDIIFSKPNPMPESVTDRCTKSHEYMFLLSKSERYYFDQKAILEPVSVNTHARLSQNVQSQVGSERANGGAKTNGNMKAVGRGVGFGHGTDAEARGRGRVRKLAGGQDATKNNSSFDEAMAIMPTKRNRRSVWTVPTESYKGAHFACVDEGTECLTINGWKRHADLVAGVLAAQFDITTGLLSWASIEDIARYPVVNQLMVAAKSRDVEMLLTPNHRTIIARRDKETRQWKSLSIIRADEMKPSHAVPVSAAWQESGNEPFSADWAELIGWYLAEGCESGSSWSVEIYQSQAANPEKVARIRALLVLLGAEFLEATAPRVWFGRNATMVAFQVRGFAAVMLRQWAPGKRFHPSVLGWSAGLLDRLMIGLVDGDGHRRPDGRFSFIQRDENSASLAQAIGVRLGYSTMLSRRTGNTFAVYFTRKRLISFRGTGGEGAEIMQRPYTGTVWCPKLPAGTWVARKNGRSFITGNTFPRALIEPCVLAGSKPGGTVLDIFFGSGTTGQVAQQLGRNFIGIELNPAYKALQDERLRQPSLDLEAA